MAETSRRGKLLKHEWPITTFDSTKLSIHWSLLVVVLILAAAVRFWLVAVLDPDINTYLAYAATALFLTGLLVSLVGREVAQAQVAKHHGVGVTAVSISAIGGRTKADSVPPHPKAEFQISSAGLLFTGSTAAILLLVSVAAERVGMPLSMVAIAFLLGWLNLALAIINLAPAVPLDGGRMLSAVLWHRRSSRSLGQIAASRTSIICGTLLLVGGLAAVLSSRPGGIAALIIGIFAVLMGRSQIRQATVRRRLETTRLAELMVESPELVPGSLTVERLQAWAKPERFDVAFPVSRWDTNPIGYVVPNVALKLSEPERSWTRVDRIMEPRNRVPRAWCDESIGAVLQRTGRTQSLVVVAHDPASLTEVGTVTSRQIQHLFAPPNFWGRTARKKVRS